MTERTQYWGRRRALRASSALLTLVLILPAGARAADDATTLPEVVVTAPAMEQPMVIETDTDNPRTPIPPADGAGYLKNIPGFSVARQGAIDGDPVLRGIGGSRLNILLDETPVLGGCPNRMDPPTAYIFPGSFDKLTVLKGPQSVVHGGSAMGTILVERTPPKFDKTEIRGTANALYGSNDRNDEVIEAVAGAKEGYLRAIGTHSSSDDYKDGNGNALHSRYWRHSGTAMVGWTPDTDTLLQFSFDKSQAQAAMPGKMMDGTQFDREGVNLEFTKTNISPLLAKLKFLAYHNYVDHVMDTYSMRYTTTTMMTAASQVDHLMQGGKALVELTPDTQTLVSLGVDYNRDEHTARSQSAAEYRNGVGLDSKMRVKDIGFDTYSGFGEVSRELSAVDRVIGGYRLTHVQATRHNVQPNLTDDRTLHSGFVRYERNVDVGLPLTTFASLGHVERAPDYWERNKVTASDRTFKLATEKTEQLDIGALFKRGNWRSSASLFYAYTDDFILVASADAKSIEARRWGGEGDIAYKFLPSWSVEANAAYVHGNNLTDGTALAQTPPLDTSLAVKYDDGEFMGAFHMRAVAGQHRTQAGWGSIIGQDIGETGGFAVFSLNGGWRVNDAVTFTGGVDNIFDKTYAEHISKTGAWSGADLAAYNDTVRVNEPGRTFWMRGSVKF
ncbi:TonB-dependent copper receptor [Magnetospirillum gryphiswaldense]|uniref:TonB-dependent outer membrane receptor n=1 Tax=Magnetospirillum gryphiswaldense TaxID=55518 RepID=A4U5N6_9PROT|nr:TonB-dependent copper receptor [Magnetospirillum gryphiswaldense]AVM73011.1 Ferrienterobactin receptor precursor [Magnetospirillum gryphiswaldense MSR-1]AVM76914.1 Ferrienterobactin receptor precursor [Magnetospirillum gryphiswaldense]CAM78193.1 TonB-dependent outer membrane receptor [Magnetospirillum gryphiswaldense MSR-1]